MTTIEVFEKLCQLVAAHPEARIVTDVGASMVSGWGDLIEATYESEFNVIELTFS